MPDWNILVADGLSDAGMAILRTHAHVDSPDNLDPDELLQIIPAYDALIVRSRTRVTPGVFSAGERLKVVGRAGVGVDNIDLAAAARRGVRVVNSPLATTLAVAEQTLALMFALARSLPRADAAMKSGLWIKKELEGIELNGKVLGIIGVGHIGSAVARRASALGMDVLGYDPIVPAAVIRQNGAEPVSINDLYARADFISLHVPLTPETRNLVNGQSFEMMKRGVRVICTSRGGVIDETALLAALESGQVAGAGLDVFAKEPPGLTALVAHTHVVATPHASAQTVEAQARAATDIAEEVLAALRGESLRWKIV